MTLAFATVRSHWPSFVGSFVALGLGVALLTATLGVYASAQPAVPDRYAGAPVYVQSPAAADPDRDTGSGSAGEAGSDEAFDRVPWSPERVGELVQELAAVPGVVAAVPDRPFYAQVLRDGRPLDDPPAGYLPGRGWSAVALAPYRLTAGAPPARAGEVALGEEYGLAPGERVTLLTAAGPARHTVSGTVDGSGIYLPDSRAQRLAAGVTAIGLVTRPGADPGAVADAARAVLGSTGGEVLTGEDRVALEPESHTRIRWVGAQLLSTMALFAVFAAVFVVASTFSLAAHQRRRELALLRATGATPRQVRRLLLGEALLVGTVAVVTGAALGVALTPVLGELLVRAEVEPPGFVARAAALPVAASAGTGLVVALLAVSVASRRVGRVRPLEALRDADVDQRPLGRGRWVCGVLAVGCGLALAVTTAQVEGGAVLTTAAFSAFSIIVGLALLAPAGVPPVVRAATVGMDRVAGATGMLVRESALAATRRTAATAAPVLLTVGMAVLVFGMVATLSPAFGDDGAQRAGAGVVAAPEHTPGLSDAAVAAVPGESVSVLPSTVYADVPGGVAALDAAGVSGPPAGPGCVPDPAGDRGGTPDAASLVVCDPDAVAVSAGAAARYGWETGDAVRFTFADGRTGSVRVVAVVADDTVPAPVLLARDTVRAHDRSALTAAVYVRGADRTAVARAVTGLGAAAVDAVTYAAQDDENRLVWLFALIIVGMSAGYTGIAVANTLMMATAGRRRDLTVLRWSGATAGQALRTVAAETVLVVGVGAGLGAAVALPALLGIRSALADEVGRAVALVLPWPEILAVVGGCVALALAASLASAGAALRGGTAGRR